MQLRVHNGVVVHLSDCGIGWLYNRAVVQFERLLISARVSAGR